MTQIHNWSTVNAVVVMVLWFLSGMRWIRHNWHLPCPDGSVCVCMCMCVYVCVSKRPCFPLYDGGAVFLPPNQTLVNVTFLPRGVNIPGNQAPDEKPTRTHTQTQWRLCRNTGDTTHLGFITSHPTMRLISGTKQNLECQPTPLNITHRG